MDMQLKQTTLRSRHVDAGAKLVPFAGYEMPLSYESIIAEHLAVRRGAGLFDLSHMGEIYVTGDGCLDFLDRVLTNDPRSLPAGRAQYNLMLNQAGGVIDDLILYRLSDGFLLVVNAARRERDVAWLMENRSTGVAVEDRSDDTGIVAVQGPEARNVLLEIGVENLDSLHYMEHREDTVAGRRVLLACSGYTGEDGFELISSADNLPTVWDSILSLRPRLPVSPVGLGARDTLRTEMCYHLYGQELNENTNPIEAELAWVCRRKRKNFIGSRVLSEVEKRGPERSLVAFKTEGPVPPRPGFSILIGGKESGGVTSGTYSPSLETGIGMGFVPREHREVRTELTISGRGREISAAIERKPLYRGGTIRRRAKT